MHNELILELLKQNRNMGYLKTIGFKMTDLSEGYARAEIELDYRHANPIGTAHGGVIFSLCDSVGGAAASSRGRFVTTMDANINYMRPAAESRKLIGESREIKIDGRTCIYDVMVTDDLGTEIAIARLTYFYLGEITEEYLRENIARHELMEKEQKFKLD